jgi:hypothetical protein
MKRFFAVLVFGVVSTGFGQLVELTPRELFYRAATQPKTPDATKQPVKEKHKSATPLPPVKTLPDGTKLIPVQANSVHLGLKCQILRESGAGWEEAPLTNAFHTGDHIRIRVEANAPSYLYIVQQGASGNWDVLFPRSSTPGSNRVNAFEPVTLPNENQQITFREPVGTENLFIMLSEDAIDDFDKLLYSVGKDRPSELRAAEQPKVQNTLVSKLQASVRTRDLVIEPVTPESRHDSSDKHESATYWVNYSERNPGRVVATFQLKHQ